MFWQSVEKSSLLLIKKNLKNKRRFCCRQRENGPHLSLHVLLQLLGRRLRLQLQPLHRLQGVLTKRRRLRRHACARASPGYPVNSLISFLSQSSFCFGCLIHQARQRRTQEMIYRETCRNLRSSFFASLLASRCFCVPMITASARARALSCSL